MEKRFVSQQALEKNYEKLAEVIKNEGCRYLYGVPRGGTMIAVELVERNRDDFEIVADHRNYRSSKVAIVDDVYCTGNTLGFFKDFYKCFVLFSKSNDLPKGVFSADKVRADQWLMFPWERDAEEGTSLVTRILEYIGEDPFREGLRETPQRVVEAWRHWFSGYTQNLEDIVKVFYDDSSDEMILLKDIEFSSMCEHHMAPFYGKAHVAYIPDKKLIGASKLARIVDLYAKRLQIQERICNQVTAALEELLQPKGVACLIEAKHSCISSRGVQKQCSVFTTSSLTGAFKENFATRNEFLKLIKQ
jgi:GTP cyclohydrolase I